MKVHLADVSMIDRSLRRKRRRRSGTHGVDLRKLLSDILSWANEFVPSESGSVLLDDPVSKLHDGRSAQLHFVACFGRRARGLVGTSISSSTGIVGETYRTGKPYICEDVRKDKRFCALPDASALKETHSLIAVPIHIDQSIVGVIELINRKGQTDYDRKDLSLLQIFAGYTATLVQNALDGRRFAELSRRDSLTGLYNYQFVFSRMVQEVRRALRKKEGDVAQIFFDLDHLKKVNDTYGHLAGSRIIVEVADLMRMVFNGINALMARYGGDEYIVVLPDMNLDEASAYAEVLRDRISRHIFLARRGPGGMPPLRLSGVVTCSVGVASLRVNTALDPDARVTTEALTKAADVAMYRAKKEGKNRMIRARAKSR